MSQHSHPWIGRSIGEQDRYRLEQRLGGGGMGDVFLATDTRLGKPVALKLLKETLLIDPDLNLQERFERECAICAALKSVHIVQVSDYGITTEGYPFYVMEYLQGQTLGDRLSHGAQLTVAQTCNIITQVCEGLELAHQGVMVWSRETNASERIKIVHRDLKPDNIFLVPTVLGELAKIIDFGIAKINSLQAEYTSNTAMFMGTCHYAAPEQFDLRCPVDERSDIYSLGVILYEMLAGTDPFGFDFKHNRVTNQAWLSAHAAKQPIPLRTQPRCRSISPTLEAIVQRCLAKLPADRFSSVTELKNALATIDQPLIDQSTAEDIAADSPTVVAPLHSTQPDAKVNTEVNTDSLRSEPAPLPTQPQSRRKFPVLALGGITAVLAVGLYGVLWSRQSLPPIATLNPRSTLNSSAVPSSSPANSPANPQSNSPLTNHPLALAQTLTGTAPARSVVFSPDGKTLISAGEEQDSSQHYPIKVWNLGDQQVQRTLVGHDDVVQALSLSSDGQLLASGGQDGQIKLWNPTTGELLKQLSGHTAPVQSVALSADRQTLISGSEDKTVRIWDLQTNQSRTLAEHSNKVYSVAISPDSSRIASGGADKTIRLWDAQTGELLRTLGEPGGHRDTVSAVAFSPDGQHLVSAGWDGFVKLWDANTGQLLRTFEGHTDRILSVAFIDNEFVASAGLDRTIQIWSLDSNQSIQTIPAHTGPVLAVTAFADQTLASSSGDTTIKIWR